MVRDFRATEVAGTVIGHHVGAFLGTVVGPSCDRETGFGAVPRGLITSRLVASTPGSSIVSVLSLGFAKIFTTSANRAPTWSTLGGLTVCQLAAEAVV